MQCFGLKNCASASSSIHNHKERCIKAQMENAFLFFYCRLLTQPIPVHKTFARIGIDREIANLKRCQVLEKVAALRGGHSQVTEARLHNHARTRNLVPCDGDAEPGIIGTPPANADQEIRRSVFAELRIQLSHKLCYLAAPGPFKAVKVHENHVAQITDSTVAKDFRTLT